MRLLEKGACMVALAISAMSWSTPAHAKAEAESPYSLSQTFGTALRMLRVDLGLEVTEKDAEASYLLFRYRLVEDPKRVVDGAIEMVALDNRIRIIVKIPQLPESHERLLRDRLTKKLRDDFGEPPKRVEPPKPPPAPAEKPPKPEKSACDPVAPLDASVSLRAVLVYSYAILASIDRRTPVRLTGSNSRLQPVFP